MTRLRQLCYSEAEANLSVAWEKVLFQLAQRQESYAIIDDVEAELELGVGDLPQGEVGEEK